MLQCMLRACLLGFEDSGRVWEGGAVPEEAHGVRQAGPPKRRAPRPCVRVRGERHLQNVHGPAENEVGPREKSEVRMW